MSTRSFSAFVDRIEDNSAVLLIGEDQRDIVVIPCLYLPEGVRGGHVVSILITDDPCKTASNRADILQLIDDLKEPSDS